MSARTATRAQSVPSECFINVLCESGRISNIANQEEWWMPCLFGREVVARISSLNLPSSQRWNDATWTPTDFVWVSGLWSVNWITGLECILLLPKPGRWDLSEANRRVVVVHWFDPLAACTNFILGTGYSEISADQKYHSYRSIRPCMPTLIQTSIALHLPNTSRLLIHWPANSFVLSKAGLRRCSFSSGERKHPLNTGSLSKLTFA